MTFGRELVVLLTTPSMFGKFLVHLWKLCGGLNKGHSIYRFIEGQTHFGKFNRCYNKFDPQ